MSPAVVRRRPSQSGDRAVTHCSASKDDIDSRQDEPKLTLRQLPNAFSEILLVERHDLRDVGDRLLGESCRAWRQRYISGRVAPFQITRQCHADDRRDSTSVERIALDDNDRPSKARARAPRLGKVGPPHVPLGDAHHSVRANTRRPVAAANESMGSPSSASARSIASVTRSGE